MFRHNILISALILCPVSTSCGDELAVLAINAHEATVQQIQSLSCQVEWTSTNLRNEEKSFKVRGKYYRNGSLSRAVQYQSELFAQRDYFTDGKTLKVFETSSLRKVGGAIRSAAKEKMTFCDADALALIKLPLPNEVFAPISLRQLCNGADGAPVARKKTINGKPIVILSFTYSRANRFNHVWKIEIYLNTDLNYMIEKIIYKADDELNGIAMEKEHGITEFREIKPSIYFPISTYGKYVENGVTKSKGNSVISDIKINQPLPKDAFAFRFVRGLQIDDHIRNTRYKVDEMGNRISPEKPLGQRPVAPPEPTPIHAVGRSTYTEYSPWYAWLPWIFGTVFLVSLARWVYLRKRMIDE